MVIKTKFSPNENVWLIKDHRAIVCKIIALHVCVNIDGFEIEECKLSDRDNLNTFTYNAKFLFKTKKKLLESL